MDTAFLASSSESSIREVALVLLVSPWSEYRSHLLQERIYSNTCIEITAASVSFLNFIVFSSFQFFLSASLNNNQKKRVPKKEKAKCAAYSFGNYRNRIFSPIRATRPSPKQFSSKRAVFMIVRNNRRMGSTRGTILVYSGFIGCEKFLSPVILAQCCVPMEPTSDRQETAWG